MGAAEAIDEGYQDHRQVRPTPRGEEVRPGPGQVYRLSLTVESYDKSAVVGLARMFSF